MLSHLKIKKSRDQDVTLWCCPHSFAKLSLECWPCTLALECQICPRPLLRILPRVGLLLYNMIDFSTPHTSFYWAWVGSFLNDGFPKHTVFYPVRFSTQKIACFCIQYLDIASILASGTLGYLKNWHFICSVGSAIQACKTLSLALASAVPFPDKAIS